MHMLLRPLHDSALMRKISLSARLVSVGHPWTSALAFAFLPGRRTQTPL